MARKKAASTAAAETEETTEETSAEAAASAVSEETAAEETSTEETSTEETSTEETSTEETSTEETAEETSDASVVQVVYIGPTIPKARLTSGGIVRGTQEEVDAYIAEVTAKYAKAKYLFVTPDKLAEAKRKVKTKGNILNKYYRAVLDQARART